MKTELVQFLGTAVIYIVGAYSCIYRGVSVGTLYAFLSCMGIILTTMNGWLNMVLTYQSADVGMRKIYDVLKERLGKDLLSGDGGVSLTLSVVSREEGIRNLRGELIAHAPTLGAAQAEALAVVASLTDLCEEENSPVLTVKRGLFRFRQDESGRGFSTVETVEICLSEGSGEDV